MQEPTDQNRNTLIQGLRQEYKSQREHSLQEAAMIALGTHKRTDTTCSSLPLTLHESSTTVENPLPSCTSISEAYDHAGQQLLILGEPGAGKTTLLLELACELLTRAEGDPTLPIPIILHLSSWASQTAPLESWLIDQLQLTYTVPSRLSRTWLEQKSCLLLLDGLDEVEETLRPACIEAINSYVEDHHTPLVVCSRSHEYLTQEPQLTLSHTVVVQPLQQEQIIEYLEPLGASVATIREVVRSNPKLITTPLMLNSIILAYRNKPAIDLPPLSSLEEQQRQIFDHCTKQLLEQRTVGEQFTPQQTRRWLAWLAQHMNQYHLTQFYLEWLQPSCLTTERSQTQYRSFYMLFYGVIGGLLYGVIGGLIYSLIGQPLYGIVLGLILGVVLGLVGGTLADISIIRPTEGLTWSWNTMWQRLFAGLADTQKLWLAESLSWSWNSVWQGVMVGGVLGVIGWLIGFGLIGGVILGLIGGVLGGLIVGLLGGLLTGLTCGLMGGGVREVSGERISKDMRPKPNRGIHDSGWKALCFGLIGGVLGGLIIWLIGRWLGGQMHGLILGIFLGVFLATLIAQAVGGRAYVCHYILRYILYRNGVMPWHYVRFLEEATERTLLQRTGGGYRFMHPLFADTFASQETSVSPDAIEQHILVQEPVKQ